MNNMDIVPALLMAFVFAGAIWPQIIRSRRYYLFGFAAVVVSMLLTPSAAMTVITSPSPAVSTGMFLLLLAKLAQIAAFVLLVLAAGGGSLNDLWREFRR